MNDMCLEVEGESLKQIFNDGEIRLLIITIEAEIRNEITFTEHYSECTSR